MNKERLLPLLGLLAGLWTMNVRAQETVVVKDSVYSGILKETRKLEIILPAGGLKVGTRYDVLYVLDGEWNTTLVRQITDFWVGEGLMPPLVIVSVLNGEPNMRDRDFTPTHVADNPTSGKADNFIAFLKNELLPHIAGKYPTSGHNALFGHSLGGLFGMYALLTDPNLFDGYILGDPSFWWDNRFIYPLTGVKLRQPKRRSVALFIYGRKWSGDRQMDAAGMDSVLRTMPNAALNWKIMSSLEETHNSTKLRTLVEGLRFIYKGYVGNALPVNPTNGGIVLAGQPFTLYCYQNYIDPFHYDLDGRMPSDSSKPLLWMNQITLNQSTDVDIASVTTRLDLQQSITEHFEIGSVLPAGEKPGDDWQTDTTFSLGRISMDVGDWKKFKAVLPIKQTGYYIVSVSGANAIRWYIGNRLVLSSDHAAANGRYQSAIVPLEKGYYPILVEVKAEIPGKEPVLLYNTPASGGNGLFLLPDLLYLRTTKK